VHRPEFNGGFVVPKANSDERAWFSLKGVADLPRSSAPLK
jgi:hypothetical protein